MTSRTKHLCLIVLVLLFLGDGGYCLDYTQDPVLSQSTLTDSIGNTANDQNDMTWAPIASGASYSSDDITYDDGGMTGLYDFSRSFCNSAFPGGFPWVEIGKVLNGTIMEDVTTNYMTYAKNFAGYAACIVIGLLFIFLFPLIGCCFCCCRCCGNCGGKMLQKEKDAQSNCRRKVYASILLVLVIFTGSGMVLVYVSNDQFTKAIENVDTTLSSNADDIFVFLNATIDQVNQMVGTNFNFTRDVIFRDLDSIGYLVGIPVRDSIITNGQVNPAFASAYALVTKADSIFAALNDVNTKLTNAKLAVTALNTQVVGLKNNITTTKTSCGATCNSLDVSTLDSGIDNSNFPDISSQMTDINSVQSTNLTAVIIDANKEIQNIPWKVHNETNNTMADIKKTVNSFTDQLDPVLNSITDIDSQLTGSLNVDDMLDQVKSFTSVATQYNKYRWYGGIGLTCIILLVVVLLLLGLIFAVIGHDTDVYPTDRGCMSNSGGEMFMAAVGFIFIFSPLLMLLTTLTFMIGAPLERFVCQPLTENSFKDLDRIVDEILYDMMYSDSGYYLGKAIHDDPTIAITMSSLLTGCQAGKTAFSILHLDKKFNLTAVTDYKSNIDIESNINAIDSTVDFSSITVLTPDLLSNLNKLKDATNIDYATFRSEMNKNLTGTKLHPDLSGQLTTLAGITTDPVKSELNYHSASATAIQNNEYAALELAIANLSQAIDTLEASTNGTADAVDAVINNFNVTEQYVKNNGSSVVKTAALDFANRIYKILDSYIDDILYALDNEIGSCKPVWNLYNSLIVITFCGYSIDTLNGFWFSLGWCIFFFVPSTIFAVKLAKHYRRMKFADHRDQVDEKNLYPGGKRSENKTFKGKEADDTLELPLAVHAKRGNKVAHHDEEAPYPAYSNKEPVSDW